MANRTTINDFQKALERVDKLLEKHEPKHQGAWARQNLFTHANHGRIHAQMAETDMINFGSIIEKVGWPDHMGKEGEEKTSEIEENLASNACRALMLLERFLEVTKP
jgi:hypothetical protein